MHGQTRQQFDVDYTKAFILSFMIMKEIIKNPRLMHDYKHEANGPQSSHEKHFLAVHKFEQSMMSPVHWIKHSKIEDDPLFLKNMNPLYPRMY